MQRCYLREIANVWASLLACSRSSTLQFLISTYIVSCEQTLRSYAVEFLLYKYFRFYTFVIIKLFIYVQFIVATEVAGLSTPT